MYSSLGINSESLYKSKYFKFFIGGVFVLSISSVFLVLVLSNRHDDSYNIPQIKPPVNTAAPPGLKETSASRRLVGELDLSFHSQIRDRFFSGLGPTNIYELLKRVDIRTSEVNVRSNQTDRPCLDMEPIEVDIGGWPGESLKMWAQCYDQLSDDLFMMFGIKDDVVYLYESDRMVTIMAYVHLENSEVHSNYFPCCYQVNGGGDECHCLNAKCSRDDDIYEEGGNCRTIPTTWPTKTFDSSKMVLNMNNGYDGLPDVNVYFSVGSGYNSTQSGSRGLMHLEANPTLGRFQANVAGIGLGFCGVELASDGTKLSIRGSQDGVGGACNTTQTVCISGDLKTTLNENDCDGIVSTMIPLGRLPSNEFIGELNMSGWSASDFPGNTLNNVEIGDTPEASVNFGPKTVPISMINRKF